MLKIIQKDKVDYSVQYKIENKLELNEKDKKYIDKNFNPKIAYKLAKNRCKLYELKDYEEECLKNPYYTYLFALNISGVNIEKCQKAIKKHPYWLWLLNINLYKYSAKNNTKR